MSFATRQDNTVVAFERAAANGDQYVTRVNKGRLDVERHTDLLNAVWRAGFRLFAVFEQGGNTVMVFERRAEVAA